MLRVTERRAVASLHTAAAKLAGQAGFLATVTEPDGWQAATARLPAVPSLIAFADRDRTDHENALMDAETMLQVARRDLTRLLEEPTAPELSRVTGAAQELNARANEVLALIAAVQDEQEHRSFLDRARARFTEPWAAVALAFLLGGVWLGIVSGQPNAREMVDANQAVGAVYVLTAAVSGALWLVLRSTVARRTARALEVLFAAFSFSGAGILAYKELAVSEADALLWVIGLWGALVAVALFGSFWEARDHSESLSAFREQAELES